MKKILLYLTILILLINFISAETDVTVGLTHYYQLQSDASDSVGTTDGTLNGVTSVSGILGNGYYFDNTDDITLATSGIGHFNEPTFSINVWINISNGAEYAVWSYDPLTHADPYYAQHIRKETDEAIYFGFNNDGVLGATDTVTGSLVSIGSWAMLTTTFTSGEQKVYVNGVLKATTTTANSPTYYEQEVWLGRANFGGYFQGTIDEVGFWDEVLNQTEITLLYNSGNAYNITFATPVVTSPVNVTANSWINNTAISTFNITINGINYTTTNGTINTEFFTNSTVLFNITYNAPQHTTITYNDLNITTGNYDGLITESTNIFVNFYAYDNNNDLMGSPKYDIQTSTGSTSNTGNPTQVNLLEFINSTSQTMNITVNITDNLNLMQSYTNTYIINRTLRRINSTLDANQLILYFENEDGTLTNVYVQIESGNYSWNKTTNNYTFYQENLSIGNVYVKIAKDNSSNTFTQFFEYYNDYSTHILKNITIFNTVQINFSVLIIGNTDNNIEGAEVKMFQTNPSSTGEENLFLGQKLSTNKEPITFYKGIQNVKFEVNKNKYTTANFGSYGIETLYFHTYTNPLEFTLIGGGIIQLKGLTIIIPKYTKNKSVNIPVYIHSPTSSNVQIITDYMTSTGQARLGLTLTENNDMYDGTLISGTHFSSGIGNVTINIYKDGIYHSEFIVFDKVNELGQNLFEKPSGIDEKILLIVMVIGVILASGFISTQIDHEDAGIFAFYSLALIMTLISGTFIWAIIIPAIMLLGQKLLGLGGDQL